jgi:acetoin utilization deacetylase AcuC-like enzyme
MLCFWDDRERLHAPSGEFFNGAMHGPAEHAARVDAILAAIGPTVEPEDRGTDPLLRVHPAEYLDFLKTAHRQWRSAGRDGDAFPYTFPVVRRRLSGFNRIDGMLGHYSFDTSTPIAEHSWESAYWSAQAAIAASRAVIDGGRVAFGLCRPPGHHAGADYLGGYCYLANAAIAAEQALAAGKRKVAVLDVDYHHGNGTQDIFYERGDVMVASIHADPATDYPFFWGYADETGDGPGAGANLNLPLPRGTDWPRYEQALLAAVEWIASGEPEMLIVSFGADTYERDPISRFELRTDQYRPMARRIESLGLPTAILMEGGYAVDALGNNVAEFLAGF